MPLASEQQRSNVPQSGPQRPYIHTQTALHSSKQKSLLYRQAFSFKTSTVLL
jgi:hypothetical protein